MLLNRVKNNSAYPAILLDSWLGVPRRRQCRYVAGTVALALIGGNVVLSSAIKTGALAVPGWLVSVMAGLGLISLALFLALTSLEFFYRFYYYRRLNLQNGDVDLVAGVIVVSASRVGDYLQALIKSDIGQKFFCRLGLDSAKLTELLDSQVAPITDLDLPSETALDFPALATGIFNLSPELKKLCAEEGITMADFNSVALLTAWERNELDRANRWWGREAFDLLPTIGDDWAYGQLYRLKKYANDLSLANLSLTEPDSKALEQVELVLSRSAEANVLLVGEAGSGGLALISSLSRRAKTSAASSTLAGRKFMVINVGLFLAQFKERYDLETELLATLNEAARAGNIIVVLDDLPVLLAGARDLGANLPSLLDPFLAEANFQLVALAETRSFHNEIEPLSNLMNRFEIVRHEDTVGDRGLLATFSLVRRYEQETSLIFTYRAIKEISRAAENFFSAEGTLGDETNDLLIELLPWLARRGLLVVDKTAVTDFLREKTKVPQGVISGVEKEQLLKLEEVIHQRIIGQNEAVNGVAEAMRRSRAGLRNENKPIASFLFLGPTGVGKTETAKALAEAMFGKEDKILRLDMSEYQSADAVNRLIGEAGTGRAGTLTTLVRGEPYGVLLLDEFEKSHRDVRNLFLQILDEGFFSDMMGKKVFLRQHLIIATSNAGADLIWELVKSDQDVKAAGPKLIDSLVQRAIFTPELLNRFDATIIFRPLTKSELVQVAQKMLNSLNKKLAAEGINFKVTPELAAVVAERGANKVFGARPMQRFIQDKIESVIAKQIIAGTITKGFDISLQPNDIA